MKEITKSGYISLIWISRWIEAILVHIFKTTDEYFTKLGKFQGSELTNHCTELVKEMLPGSLVKYLGLDKS